ncbi:MAG: MBL fold metallo-hydrolase [Clostridia bacterium]|nr:MBL fold metallo-hydrolase [Clostridia bacterium]
MAFIDRELMPGVHHIEDALGVCFTLLVGRERALLVDAGYGLEDVAAFVRTVTDKPLTLWLTHGHHDHALGAMWFDRPRLHPDERAVYAAYTGAARRRAVLETAKARGVAADEAAYLAAPMPEPVCCAGETLDLGGLTARVMPCPGHTPGSMAVYAPERALLLTGDDWNPCTWLFFPEALPLAAYRENLRSLLALPFEWALCPHRAGLFRRDAVQSFADGLTDEAVRAAKPVDNGAALGVRAFEAALPGGQVLVFDADKARDLRRE